MKKIILLCATSILILSCSNNEDSIFEPALLTIDSYEVPQSFTFGEIDSIKVTYSLPNNCFRFNRLYYQIKDTTRIVAINAIRELNTVCSQQIITKEFKFAVLASQTEDYLFRFFKGVNDEGVTTFDEVIVPVN